MHCGQALPKLFASPPFCVRTNLARLNTILGDGPTKTARDIAPNYPPRSTGSDRALQGQ